MTVQALIPFHAEIKLEENQVQIIGPVEFIHQVHSLKDQYGNDPRNWPLLSVQKQYAVLINEFILKIKNNYKPCYEHEELCHCRMVATEKVLTALKSGCDSVSEVSRTTLAGTGCGTCRSDIENLIQQFVITK